MDHMNQEPLDFAAALTLLRKARAEITRLRTSQEETATEGRSRHELILDIVNLRKALFDIREGKGAFSHDPLTHASNTIEDMKAIAKAALAGEYLPQPQSPSKETP